jgi:phosphoribosyl 1,2-cyclic phosphodiesterase
MTNGKVGPVTTPGIRVKLWGTRGSLPVSGPEFREFGGNTICIEVRCGDRVLLIDAGSGLFPAGSALRAEGQADLELFFTHCHYDHIVGLPFFGPLYCQGNTLTVSSGHMADDMTTSEMISQYMRKPFFPIGPDMCCARIETHDFRAGDVLTPHPGIVMRTAMLNHPGGSTGYRIEWAGRAVAVITDTEHEPDTLDPAVLGLIQDADLMLYDATFTDEEFGKYRSFGHSTWQQGVRLAQAAGVGRVGFIHHAKWRTDADLTKIEHLAKEEFAGAFVGRDLQVIEL